MEGLIRLLIAFFLLLAGAGQSAEPPLAQVPPGASEGQTIHSETIIDSVDAMLLESYPVQIRLSVSGSQPDGCDYPVQVVQHRDGNTVTVEIFREVPPNAICPMILRSYNETIALEGGFESGTYTIHVNDYTLEVVI
jgi:hypothetical protein